MSSKQNLSRRKFFAYFSSIGFTSTLFPKILWAKFQEQDEKKISSIMLQEAEKIAGLEFTDEERELMLEGVNNYLEAYEKLRTVKIDNSVPPAIQFSPILPGMSFQKAKKPLQKAT